MQVRRSLLAPAGALVLALALCAARCPAQAAPAGGAHQLNIGVVNTTRVLDRMTEIKKLKSDYRARQITLNQQAQQKDMELQEMQKHRDNNVKPGSQQWKDETAAIFKKRAEMEVWLQTSKLEDDQFYKENLKAVYDHLNQATAQVAEAQHLDLVIADAMPEIGPDLDNATREQLQMLLAARAVLYANKKADITEDVLTFVEANFAKQNPQGASAPPPPPVPAPGPTGK